MFEKQQGRNSAHSISWHPFATYEKYPQEKRKMASMFGMEWFEVALVSLVIWGVTIKDLIKMYLYAKKRRQMLSLPAPTPQLKQIAYR
jgi:hypothetical protein